MNRWNFKGDKAVIYINYHESPYKLEKIEKGDWVDLYCIENIKMKKGEFKLISQGISMQLPQGYEAILAPRSSTFKKYGILQANSIGIIDNSYCGDNDIWLFPALATRDVEIPAGSRICQFRIQKKQPEIIFKAVDSLGNNDRSGFGSTGD